ncbi:MAG TPA: 50S ribosomal protein L21 [Rhizobiales bacterium]|nr:50S ribosomal protein L21 [Hyphomicrobiales bacterium]
MYAVIKTGGKQYRVAVEDKITVERLAGEAGDIIELNEVLMLSDGENVEVGAPLIEGASVAAELVEQARGKKIIVFKKKRRKHYRRRNGHRQDLSILKITEILTGGKKPSKKAAAKPAAKKAAKPAAEKAAPKPAAKKEALPEGALFAKPAGEPDDLKVISGVGPVLEKKLNDLGIYTYAQVAAFTKEDIVMVDDALSFKGRIERDDWLSQAKKLAEGK